MKSIVKKAVPQSLRSRTSFAIIVTAAILVEITSGVQYYFAQKGISESVESSAQAELKSKSLEIRNVMNVVEVAVDNMAWAVEQRLSQPDSMVVITRKLLADNEYIVGSAIAFEPYYYKQKGRQFSPYSYKHGSSILSKQLGTDTYDYHNMEWYTVPMKSGRGHWSEPYYDEGGGEMLMSTYSLPIHNAAGRCIAIFTADVSLEWLSKLVNSHHVYPSSYNILLSRVGRIIVCPVDNFVMRKNIAQVTSDLDDTVATRVNREMLAGKSGNAEIRNAQGETDLVFYAQMDKETGWSMAVVYPEKELYSSLIRVALGLFILMLVGLALMGFIIWRAARSAKHLQEINTEKERIGSELRIASEIQKSMLPKTFPPYPDRDEITIYGQLTPAKAVGGDLYDFYIRDEKLFYCVGDVSGKGVPASLVMAVTRALFRTISAHVSEPEQIVRQLSNTIAEDNEMNMFVTLFVGVIDLKTGFMTYCNAGHDAPMLISKNGRRVGMLPVDSNLPAGIMYGWDFTRQETTIDSETTIFIFTDGLTEAENVVHEQFGEERIVRIAKAACTERVMTPHMLIDKMTDEVRKFVGEAEQSDDLTMMAILYNPKKVDFHHSLTLVNDISAIPRLHEFLVEFADKVELDATLMSSLDLALEESVVNVMEYAYPKGTSGTVNIVSTVDGDFMQFVISDAGKPFDPTKQKNVDINLPAEKRPIGGLGIFLVRQIMDTVTYERVEGRNILTLRKKFK